MSMLSDEYCEGWCADGCKGSWEDCTGCTIHKIESQLSAEREARERLEKVLAKIAHDGCELVGDDYCINLEGFDHDLWCHACIASEVLNVQDMDPLDFNVIQEGKQDGK